MSHELIKLTSKLYNTPHLTTEAYLDKVFTLLEDRNTGKFLAVTDVVQPRERRVQFYPESKLGVIDVHGAISDIPYYGLCGEQGVSHQSLREEMKALVELGATTVVMDSDTSGGMAHMAFESANYIRELADENGIKLISYVSAKSYSAGYVYSAVAHEVITNPSSEVGSIGVMLKLRNVSGAMKNMGIEDIYVTAGENKVPFDSEGKFTDEFLAEMKEGVLELYDQFTDHVAMWRGLDKQQVIALGANSFTSKKALANGLVDKSMTLEEFKSYLDSITSGDTMTNPVASMLNKPKKKETVMSNESVDVQAQLESLEKSLTAKFDAAILAKDLELNALRTKLENIEQEKKLATVATRLKSLTDIVGEAQADSLNTSLAALDDVAFESVLSSLKMTAVEKEKQMSTEVGDDSGVVVVTEDVVMTKEKLADLEGERIKLKYNQKRS